jgi:hypothetical protein
VALAIAEALAPVVTGALVAMLEER